MLSCCYCDSPLEAVMLETNAKTGEQRLLWACRNMRKQKCFFPIGLPSEIFFLKRSAVEKEEGVIPRPNIRLLPRKYWGLYPTVFADELRARSQASTRTGTSMSDHTTDHYSCPANSPTTSGSSVPSDHAAVDQLLKMGSGTSIWEDSPSRPKRARIASFSSGASSSERGDSNMSVAADSSSTFSSTDASERSSGSALAELICDRLQYTGVDIGRLEDDELVSQMAGVVKKLHKEKPSRGKYPG
ncbi:hypothetical protein GCK32_015963 [Trichostrongylus colubriformis]|uniref:Uncharacterized protein n=1 Tax=Trichostrongylus colubriformis TaxID=6319 RepID=A0AAN8F2T2_TRICO